MCRRPSKCTRRVCLPSWHPRPGPIGMPSAPPIPRRQTTNRWLVIKRTLPIVSLISFLRHGRCARGSKIEDSHLQSSIIHPRLVSSRIERIHHQPFMLRGRTQILIEGMSKYAMGHHRVAIVCARSRPDHVRIVGAMIVAVTGGCFGFVNTRSRIHATVDAPDCLVSRPPRHVQINGDVDAVILHALKTPDGLAKDNAVASVFAGDVEDFLSGADLVGG